MIIWILILIHWHTSADDWHPTDIFIPLASTKEGILVLPCLSVGMSTCGQNGVHSVSSTILAGSISYLHILSSNFRRCVTCKVFFFKIQKCETLANSWNFWLWLCLFSCDQAALQMVFSVCPSVRPSVTPFWLCSHHRIIMKFSGVITND